MSVRTIASRDGLPWGRALWASVAATCGVAALVTGNAHLAIAAVLPAFVAGSLWLTRPQRFRGEVTDVGLEVFEPRRESVPFHEIVAINVWGLPYAPDSERIPDGPLSIVHRRGVVELPGNLDVRCGELLRFFYEKFIPPWNRNVHPLLESYLREQEQRHGAENVWTFSARGHLGRVRRKRRPFFVSAAFALAGVCWAVIGSLGGKEYDGWYAGGLMLAIFAGLFAVLFSIAFFAGRGAIQWRDYSLIVSPDGMALVQGDSRGQIRWDELRSAKLRFKAKGLVFDSSQAKPGIVLTFEGASVLIPDVYDHPLPYIESVIRRYWQAAA